MWDWDWDLTKFELNFLLLKFLNFSIRTYQSYWVCVIQSHPDQEVALTLRVVKSTSS